MAEWSGCWEDRSDRVVCRWMVAWISFPGSVVGCVGGYSGGGAFQLEKFARLENALFIEADCSLSDHLDDERMQAAEDCQDLVLSFHDENAWFDADNLRLKAELAKSLEKVGKFLMGGNDLPPEFIEILKNIGITAIPKKEPRNLQTHGDGRGRTRDQDDAGLEKSSRDRVESADKNKAGQIETVKEGDMKAKLIIEGEKNLSIDLSYDDLASAVSNLPDTDDYTNVYAVLSAHPSVSVRDNVASKDKLDEATVNVLADDRDVAVIRSLVRSEKAREFLSTEQLVAIINRDVDAAESIAGYIESYEGADAEDVAEAIAKHLDPRVRNALAGNSSAPKKVLKNLLKDDDPRVRASAKQSLD